MSYENCNAAIIQDWLHTEKKKNILFYLVI